MSKKKFKKFKKKHSHHPQYVAPVEQSTPVQTEAVSDVSDALANIKTAEKVEPKVAAPEVETEAEKEEYSYVKKDVKKILIVIGSIFVLLFAAYYASIKTPIFNSMGDWLYNTLNIQTQ